MKGSLRPVHQPRVGMGWVLRWVDGKAGGKRGSQLGCSHDMVKI